MITKRKGASNKKAYNIYSHLRLFYNSDSQRSVLMDLGSTFIEARDQASAYGIANTRNKKRKEASDAIKR